jgi:hypothetical protein
MYKCTSLIMRITYGDAASETRRSSAAGDCTLLQSWAHRSYKLSERSKAMSDLCFSERKKMSVER